MIYTTDSISENTKDIIRKSSDEYIDELSKKNSRLIKMLSLNIFVIIIVGCVFHITQGSIGYIWIWPLLLLVTCVDANKKHEVSMDIAKISLNPSLIKEIRDSSRS